MKNVNENLQKRNNKKVDPLVASLMPDSDKKMGAIASASLLVALALCFWASAYEILIDDQIFAKSDSEELRATMTIIERKEEKKETIKEKKHTQQEKRKRMGGGGKRRGSGSPRAEMNRSVIRMLTAQTRNASAMAYTLMNDRNFAKDIDKVLKNSSGLQLTGKTKLGERAGKVDGAFNEGYAAGGSGGVGDALSSLIGGAAGALSTKARGPMKIPSPTDIDWGSGNSTRSASDVMKVVRNRTPGLRHIYNKYLKKNPGFQGKVTLQFTIAPGGEIVHIVIASSTTGYQEFDNEVKNAVGRWTFSKIKSGNTTVTIPFTFSE